MKKLFEYEYSGVEKPHKYRYVGTAETHKYGYSEINKPFKWILGSESA